MLTSVTFDFVDSKSGKITLSSPSMYVAATGSANCQTGQNTLSQQTWRAFFNFDTSILPEGAQVTKVEFLIRVPKPPYIDPVVYRVGFSIGSFIGAALDGNAGEWSGGSYMATIYARATDNTWLDLAVAGNDPTGFVNTAGDTDIKVWDYSIGDTEHTFWTTSLNTTRDKCKLRVTYSLPSATATGQGDAAATAGIVHPASGVATGAGSVQAVASMVSTGTAVVTGRGAASVASGVILPAGALATGRGTSAAAADQVLPGAALVTGSGWSQVTAFTISTAAAVGTGRGLSQAAACLVLPVELVASGVGSAQGAAVVDLTGSGIASGIGSAELAVTIDVNARAVATGQSHASCSLGLGYTAPPARHLATRGVQAAHSATRSLAWVHAGSRRGRRPS